MDFTKGFKEAASEGLKEKHMEDAKDLYENFSDELLKAMEVIRFKYMKNAFMAYPKDTMWMVEVFTMCEILCSLIDTEVGQRMLKHNSGERAILNKITKAINKVKEK